MSDEDDRIICYCYQVSKNKIIELIKSNNLKALSDIRKLTGASSGCGSCRFEVEEILEEVTAKINRETEILKRKSIPKNIYKPQAPLISKVISNSVIANGDGLETCHIVLENKDLVFPFVEGQSLGVLPPGQDEKGKPHHLRLYSIASSVSGDDLEGKSVSICVKRLKYLDPVTKIQKMGICSNYLCDLKSGDSVQITGPVGQSFLLPADPTNNYIFIATGTGIAPFRAFWRRLFMENSQPKFTGNIQLYFGCPYTKDILYHEEIEKLRVAHKNFQVKYAISREDKNKDGSKKYIHHVLYDNMNEVFSLIHSPKTHVYLCGLKGMEEGVIEVFRKASETRGQNWDALYEKMKKDEKRWEVEVY